jgi:hypothetical protein
MLSSLSTIQSFCNKFNSLISVVSNYYGLPIPTIYIPIRENSVANYVTGTADTTGISTSSTSGSPTFTTGYVANSQSIIFNKNLSQYLTLPNINMANLSCFSVSLWVNLAIGTSNFTNVWCISNFQRPTNDSTTKKYTWALLYHGGVIRFEYARDGPEGIVRRSKQVAITLGQWYHIVCIQRSNTSMDMDMYINNVKNTSNLYSPTGTLPQYAWQSTVHQCARSSYNADPFLSCTLDDFRFYSNKELSETDINKLYVGKNAPNDFIN